MVGFWKPFEAGEAQVAKLLELVSENLSFSQIARAMGAPSRNVVLCKFNRLRMLDPSLQHPSGSRDGNIVKIYRSEAPRLEKAKPLPAPSISVADLVPMRTEDGGPINIFNVESNQCEYPYGDPGDSDFHYCGHPTKDKSHYCVPHHEKCYQPRTERKVNVGHHGRKRS